MAIKVGINGFGRIGRCFFRIVQGSKDVEVVGINDLVPAETLAHLLRYDSVHGRYDKEVKVEGDGLVVNGKKTKITQVKDPAQLPWKELGVDIAIESTGLFTKKADAQKHMTAGAKKVIITAPANDSDLTVVIGVNNKMYDKNKHHVLSNASCTTNCLAPVAKVLHDKFGIVRGLMTTIHSYTNDQRILDLPHKDLRRARAAALSMIPTTTGAAKAVGEVLPELKGKLNGISIRVPTPNVSLVDLTAELKKPATVEEINAAIKAAAEGELKGILTYTEEELVSVDFNHTTTSSNFDAKSTYVIEKTLIKVLSWYDNEWGFSNRLADLCRIML